MHRRLFSPVEFAYWLQGAFEIGEIETFTSAQIRCIQQRMNDIPEKDGYSLALWKVLATFPPGQATEILRYMLNEVFIHDIDPTYEGDQQFLRHVHDGDISVIEPL